MNEVRIGVLGLGFGQAHLQTLVNLPGVKVAAIADRSSEDLDRVAGHFGCRAFRDGVEMIHGGGLDAVSVCISPKSRGAILEAAAEKDVALFVEKPWASDPEQARRYARIVEGMRSPVMAGFSFRFHPAVQRLKELLDGQLGPVQLLSGHYVHAWLPPADFWLWDRENGNGFLNENSCHLLDVVCFLMGKPTRIQAEGANFSGSPSEDSVVLTLRFENGGIAALALGLADARGLRRSPRIELVAANGRAELVGDDHIWKALRWNLSGEKESREFKKDPERLAATRYSAALGKFVEAVRDGATAPVGVEDAVQAVDLAAAVRQSLESGRAVEIGSQDD